MAPHTKTFSIALSILCASAAVGETFGPSVIDRGNFDGAEQITFIGVWASPSAGEITQWNVWAGFAGPMKLQMWRPISGGFQLLGSNLVDTTVGLNVLPIATGRIQVQAGDVIGFRFNNTNGKISYDGSASSYRWTNWPDAGTDVPTGGTLAESQLTGGGREYSVAATVAPVPEPASMLVLSAGLAVLARRRRV